MEGRGSPFLELKTNIEVTTEFYGNQWENATSFITWNPNPLDRFWNSDFNIDSCMGEHLEFTVTTFRKNC